VTDSSLQHKPSVPVPSVAIIVPILNEYKALPTLLAALLRIGADEIIIVDGGSSDGSLSWLNENKIADITVVNSLPGRAHQMNVGVANTSADILLFVHADTVLPDNVLNEVVHAQWGRFDVEFYDNSKPRYPTLDIIANMINWRSRVTGVATGDQAIFIRKDLFNTVGGFPQIPIMEDVAMSKMLRRLAKPSCSKLKVGTSARRWRQNGIWKTMMLMWVLRLAYFFGVPPKRLKRFYAQVR